MQWDGTNNKGIDVAEGVYFARLSLGDYSKVIKMAKVDGAANATELTIPRPTENLTLPKTKTETFTAIIEDLKGEAKTDTAMFVVPNNTIIHTLEENMNVAEKNYNMKEGATLAIPKSNWMYTTGAAAKFQNLSSEYTMWEDADNIYLTTVDPNANGSLGALIQTVAPHQTENLTNLNISIDDMTNFYFQVQDLTKNDTTVFSPTTMTIGGKTYQSDNGAITGKLEPGQTYDAMVSNGNMWNPFKIEANNQSTVYHKWKTNPTLNSAEDIEGIIRMVGNDFRKDIYNQIWDKTFPQGGELWYPQTSRDTTDWITKEIKFMGPDAPVDSTTINVYLWTGGNLPSEFSSYTSRDNENPILVEMPDDFKQKIIDHYSNDFHRFNNNTYNVNIFEGTEPPLRLVQNKNGYEFVMEKNGWRVVNASNRNFHIERIDPTDPENRIYGGRVALPINHTDGIRKNEIGQNDGARGDIEFKDGWSEDNSIFNTTTDLSDYQLFDLNGQKILIIMGRGFSFF